MVCACIFGSRYHFWVTVALLTLTYDLVSIIIVPRAYFLLLFSRDPKFGVRMNLGNPECRIPFWGHCDLELDLISRIIVSGAFLLLFGVGIPNLACGCILELRCVAYHFGVTVMLLTLTSDFVSRIIVSGSYHLHFLK